MDTDFDIAAHWEFINRGAASAEQVMQFYRELNHPPFNSTEVRLRAGQRDWMEDNIRRFSWKSLLDAGCGNGVWFPLWRELGVEFAALDRAGSAKHKVEAMAKALEIDVPFRRNKIDEMPFGDAAFDVAVTVKVLQHTPPSEIEASMAQLGRVAPYLMLLERARDYEQKYVMREDTFDHDLTAIASGLGFEVLIDETHTDLQQFLVVRTEAPA